VNIRIASISIVKISIVKISIVKISVVNIESYERACGKYIRARSTGPLFPTHLLLGTCSATSGRWARIRARDARHFVNLGTRYWSVKCWFRECVSYQCRLAACGWGTRNHYQIVDLQKYRLVYHCLQVSFTYRSLFPLPVSFTRTHTVVHPLD
jgi:hypothetical protein